MSSNPYDRPDTPPTEPAPSPSAESETVSPDVEHDRIYTPAPNERQLTVRAILTGCLIGGVVGAMNISIGLKIGWSFGGSLIAAILGYAVFVALRPKEHFTVLETNIAQTSGSAAGSMASAAGLLAPIPALAMLDYELKWWHLLLWALSVGYLGVFFAVPLRRQMVVVEKLRFPTGTATAETIVSIFAEGAEAVRKARVLLLWAVVATLFVLFKYRWHPDWIGPFIESPDLVWATSWMGVDLIDAVIGFMVAYGLLLYINPFMLGVGMLVGPRVGTSLLLGGIVGWAVLAPWVNAQGWVTDSDAIMSYQDGVRGWILWPGVAIMVADALTSLALSWRTILNTFRPTASGVGEAAGMESDEEMVPNLWWIGGLGIGTIAIVLTAWLVFDIPWWMTLVAVILSSVLAAIAVRSVGETDINPVGGMGKVTQLVFGGITTAQGMAASAAIPTNLLAAGISGSGASQAGDMMQDLKTGRMLGASPRKQIISQCIGILAGVCVVVPIYKLFDRVHDVGGATSDYPAPAAHAWKAMAEVLAEGFDALPTNALWAVVGGLAFGVIIPLLRKFAKPIAPFLPSGLAFGIAFIVPAYYPITIFLGSMLLIIWRKLSPVTCAALVFAVASGLIAGEGVTNVLTALLDLGRQTIFAEFWPA